MLPVSWAKTAAVPDDFSKNTAAFLQKIPKEIALVQKIHLGNSEASTPQTPFVIHIQDAHAMPAAQKNIARLLRELQKQFPHLSVAVEGARGDLRPDYLDLFPEHSEANRAIREELAAKGELSGAELFAWELYEGQKKSPSPKTSFTQLFGMEEPAAYRENYEIFREFLHNRSEIDTRLIRIQNQVESEGSKILSAALREFLKERERRKRGHFETRSLESNPDLAVYLPYLKRQVQQNLSIDLSDPIEQLRFPHVVRYFFVQNSEAANPSEAVRGQWQSLLQELRTTGKKDSEKTLFQALDLFSRKFLLFSEMRGSAFPGEADLASARSLWNKLNRYLKSSNLRIQKYAGTLEALKSWILLHEIDGVKLWEETELLEIALMERWAKTPEEKSWILKFEALNRLESFLHLEITHAELFKILEDVEFHQDLIRTLDPVSRGLQFWMNRAFRFYEVALERDQLMLNNALKENQSPVLVVIAGGFHSEGITQQLETRGISFAVMQPSMTLSSPLLYDSVMAGTHADLSSYFHEASPFATKRAALLFKSMLELGVPVLFSRYGLTSEQVTNEIIRAATNHPVLREAVLAKPISSGNSLSIRFEPRVASPAPERFTVASELLASSEVLVKNEFRARESVMTLAYGVAGHPDIHIQSLNDLAVQKSSEMAVTLGRLNSVMIQNQSRFIPRAEVRAVPVSQSAVQLLAFAQENKKSTKALDGRMRELELLLLEIPEYQGRVSLDTVVNYLPELPPAALTFALRWSPEDRFQRAYIPRLNHPSDVADALYGHSSNRERKSAWLTGKPNHDKRDFIKTIFAEAFGLINPKELKIIASAKGNLGTAPVWIHVFDRIARHIARGTSVESLSLGEEINPMGLVEVKTTAGFRAELRNLNSEDRNMPVALESLGFISPSTPLLTPQDVQAAAAQLGITALTGRLSRDQALEILAKHLGPDYQAFLSQAETPVQLRIPEFGVPTLEKYQAAFLVLLLNDQNQVTIHAGISKTEAAAFNELLAAEAMRWGIEPAGRIRIVGEGNEKAVLTSGSAKRSETRMRPLAMGLLLLNSNLAFKDKFPLNATAAFLNGEGLDDSSAILISALLSWDTLKQQVGQWYSLYQGMMSKGASPMDLSTRLTAALREIRATLQSA